MPEEETLQPTHDESESEEEDEGAEAVVPKIDIDPSTLTPLSPEVISKQARYFCTSQVFILTYL